MSFALDIEYLTGTSVATSRSRRDRAEWPPHPQRLFSALVAAWSECDIGDEGRAALEWLESLEPPELICPQGRPRATLTAYVPVNDNQTPNAKGDKPFTSGQLNDGRKVLPEYRNRQARHFPAIALDMNTPVLSFHWPCVDIPQEFAENLQAIAAEVGYLGHSSSLVCVTVRTDSHQPLGETNREVFRPLGRAQPQQRVVTEMRVPSPGRLKVLSETYQCSIDTGRRQEPPEGRVVPYALDQLPNHDAAATGTVFGRADDWVVFRPTPTARPLPLHKALQLTDTVRRALIRHADGHCPYLINGHAQTDIDRARPHVAIVPLPFVGHRHADGLIKGFAIVLPKEHSSDERRAVLRSLGRIERIFKGHLNWNVERIAGSPPIRALNPAVWGASETAPDPHLDHTLWATVTPLVFGHHPGRRFDSAKTLRVVRECCEQVGLPNPVAIHVDTVSKHRGVPVASRFDTLTIDGKPSWKSNKRRRLRAHVALEFAEPVQGPVIIGAGRFYGMGFCKPLSLSKLRQQAEEVTP